MDIYCRAFDFAVRILKLCDDLEKIGGVTRAVSWQLVKSGTSIGANLAEAKGGQSRADFIAKTFISLKEARETLYWIQLLSAAELVPESTLASIEDEADHIVSILVRIVKSARKRKKNTLANGRRAPTPMDSALQKTL